jgi:hypothetical protein
VAADTRELKRAKIAGRGIPNVVDVDVGGDAVEEVDGATVSAATSRLALVCCS